MLRISLLIYLVAIATSTIAAPATNEDIPDADSFENDINGFSQEDSATKESRHYACQDFSSFTCSKNDNEYSDQEKHQDHLARLYYSEVYNALIDILNVKTKDGQSTIDIERKLFQSCMNLDSTVNHLDIDYYYNLHYDNKGGNDENNENRISKREVSSYYNENNDVEDQNQSSRNEYDTQEVDHNNENQIDDDQNEDSNNEYDNQEVNQDKSDLPIYQTVFTTETVFKRMLADFKQDIAYDELSWQQLDKKLSLLGFKHSFFEIDVVKDPDFSNKKIIRLSPPSMSEWNFKKLTDVVSDIFTSQQLNAYTYCKIKTYGTTDSQTPTDLSDDDDAFIVSAQDESSEIEPVPGCKGILDSSESELKTFYINKEDRTAMDILNGVLKGIFDTMDTTNTDPKFEKLTIDEWNEMYSNYENGDTTKIDWPHVFKSYFENYEIHVNGTEYILVENQPYFFRMAELLSNYYDESITHTIISKFVAENMRYYNWTMVYDMNPINKASFCLEPNKFYSASAEILERLTLKLKPYIKKVESVLYDIAGTLHSNISSAEMSQSEKTSLLSKLKDITKHPFKNLDKSAVFEYYKDFEFTENYLVDINRYNSILRKQNLLKLRDSSLPHHKFDKSTPFSVLEVENTRNRYVLHSTLNAIIYKDQFSSNKDALYSTFGVKSASFLFSLLKETTFENAYRDFRGILSITPRVSYNPEKVDCFIRENIVKYGFPVNYDIITEAFGLRFAYEALSHHSKSGPTEEFFTAYTQDHCAEYDNKMINKVLSNVHEFSTALKCSKEEDTACDLQAFQ